ncbi:MAG: DUF433 domain-containing protein [Bryobacteraceae bacterium]|jgi:uncharacterized protein (DUF433 family)
MNIEIHKPELERRVREVVESGRFRDVDELLTKALDALAEPHVDCIGALDWSQCPAVESVPGKVSGAWVFRGTRMPVSAVFENLEDGVTIDELVELYDGLTRDQVKAVLDFAARSLETPFGH